MAELAQPAAVSPVESTSCSIRFFRTMVSIGRCASLQSAMDAGASSVEHSGSHGSARADAATARPWKQKKRDDEAKGRTDESSVNEAIFDENVITSETQRASGSYGEFGRFFGT